MSTQLHSVCDHSAELDRLAICRGAPFRLISPHAVNMRNTISDTYPIHPSSPQCAAMNKYAGASMWGTVRPVVREQVGVDQGTSMSTPIVAGGAVLVRQYFTDGWYPSGAAVPADAFAPSAPLLKAVMMGALFVCFPSNNPIQLFRVFLQ